MDRRTFLQSIAIAPLWNGLKGRSLPDIGLWNGLKGRSLPDIGLWNGLKGRSLPDIGRGRSSDRPAAGEDRPAAGARKAVLISMLPKDLSYAQRFAIAHDAGFDAIEMQTIAREDEAAEIREAARKTGLRIHSVMNADHWRFPLSSSDADVVSRSVAGMETSLRNAALWGADAVLLVPAVVDQATSYRDAWTRSQQVIRKRLLPLARELKVVIAVEEVWNKFLLSPLEFSRYVDELDSPWLKAYFDVGNIVFYGYPQDWIRSLGPRIAKVHLKDFHLDRPNGRFAWTNLGDGDIDWPEVRRAFSDVGYRGYMTTEVAAGDAAYLKDLAARVDRFLVGQKPV
jgi:hexulose-6-phosphate isomerase